eukprot:16438654-Heterocapsa_arctica.AAC.1
MSRLPASPLSLRRPMRPLTISSQTGMPVLKRARKELLTRRPTPELRWSQCDQNAWESSRMEKARALPGVP